MAGIDNNTLLYLRGDNFSDLSLNPKSITNNGVTIVNEGMFGSSFLFTGTNNLSITSDLFNFTNSDFSIDFFIKANSAISGAKCFLTNGASSYSTNGCIGLAFRNNNSIYYFDNTSGTQIVNDRFAVDIVATDLNHIEIAKANNKIYFFVNGVKKVEMGIGATLFNFSKFGKIVLGKSNWQTDANCIISNFRISNVARHTEDFVPPTQPYNSITINKTNQTDTNIEFNIEKLGQETINKVEVLVNGTVSETYIDNYDNINYLIDTELCMIGNNDITIRVTYDDTYTEELSLNHNVTVDELPLETPLLDTVERVKLLIKLKQAEKNMLSSILTSKNVEVSEEDKMSDLISKVDLLDEYNDSKLWLYKAGDSEGVIVKFIYGGISSNPSTFDSDKINVYVPRGSIGLGVRSSERIDLTHYSKLYIEGHNVVGDTCRILLSKNTNIVSDGIPLGELKSTSKVTMSFNISNYNDDFYIGIYQNGDAGIRQNYIYNIWLEP